MVWIKLVYWVSQKAESDYAWQEMLITKGAARKKNEYLVQETQPSGRAQPNVKTSQSWLQIRGREIKYAKDLKNKEDPSFESTNRAESGTYTTVERYVEEVLGVAHHW